MKRVVVTGAAGFIGRHTLAMLADRGYEVHAVSLKEGVAEAPATWHQADLLNPGEMRRVLRTVEPSHLLHFAWYTAHGKYWTSPENLHWVEASLAMLREFVELGGKRATLAGTCAEYDWQFGYCSERVTPLAPSTLYGVCKHALHTLASAYAKQMGLELAWGRIFFVYGPNEHPARLVPSVIHSMLRNEPVACSQGHQMRDFLHVGDVADACVTLLDSGIVGPVNIGSGTPIAISQLVETISKLIPQSHSVSHSFGSSSVVPDDPPLLVADVRRLTDELGWEPRFGLDAGLADTIKHLRHDREGDSCIAADTAPSANRFPR